MGFRLDLKLQCRPANRQTHPSRQSSLAQSTRLHARISRRERLMVYGRITARA
jgi:hypothetical protein